MTGPGYTDEVADESHDLIHNAELEEQKLHGRDAMTEEDPGPMQKGSLGDAPPMQSTGQQKESTMEKIKDALHMKK
ncbi:hypothetical protein BGZ63DRAFT_454804 [Mariannaea sp. PMI_226]|nr:hypothetical protein BGZ63DRAFT_454804 [Mariannaea sp. PMI_226]